MQLSVVIPIYNEEEVLPELYRRLILVVEALNAEYEVLFVDDGSTDASPQILRKFHESNKNVKVLQFSRNFGHHIAITAGLDHSSGDTVVLMDGDLQNRPEDIPVLLKKIEEGYDTVYTVRKNRQDSLLKKVSSRLFVWAMKRILIEPMAVETSIFRAMRRDVVEAVQKLREHNRFIIGLIDWVGFKQTSVEVEHERRFAGKSKYSFARQIRLALDAAFSFSTLPLQVTSIVGFLITFVSFGLGAYIILQKLLWGISVPGYASLIFSVFFMGGVQLITLGIIGSYLWRTYIETKQRPLYIIKKTIEYAKKN